MWKKKILKFLLILVVLGLGVLYLISHFHYSEGSRTGYLSKFSHKGYLFKTHEGEIYIGGTKAENSSLVNNVWAFSVPDNDDQIQEKLVDLEGHVVKLYYYQVIRSMPWQGDTRYFVYKAELVEKP